MADGGLSPLPGQPNVFACGFIPPNLFSQIKARFLELVQAKKGQGVPLTNGAAMRSWKFSCAIVARHAGRHDRGPRFTRAA